MREECARTREEELACATDTCGKRGTRRLRGASTHPCALKRGRRDVHLDTICCQTIASRLLDNEQETPVQNWFYLRCANLELEAAVGRGRSKSGFVTFRGLGVRTRKTNFRSPLRIQALSFERRPSSAARQLKVARPQPRSPTPRTDPEGQFVYISDGRDRENNDHDLS